ncbi:hypothetical protein BH18ACT5_BH18ACT5_01050 [soil metagenome]
MSVTLVIPEKPSVPDLYFWALQASFVGPGGRSGGAHLGLQWHSGHPQGTAVNWGGYSSAGPVLDGTESVLPSAMGNPHTRDYPWRPGSPYRLAISPDKDRGEGWWTGTVVDLEQQIETKIRSLFSAGERLAQAIVWTEAFCRCDAPPVAAIWSAPFGRRRDGELFYPDAMSLTYQAEGDGGCSNTDSYLLPHGFAQVTGVTRTNQAGSLLRRP